jgi:hypothetical protein
MRDKIRICGHSQYAESQTQERVDNGTGERGYAATEVSTGREEERLVGSTVLFIAWLILRHETVQINQPNRPHRIPIHSIYVLTPIPATRLGLSKVG